MPVTRRISGIPVDCPYVPYSSQVGMMDRIIKALQRSQSCLLESPTGSGKSIALLCATLAWQASEKERLIKEVDVSPVNETPVKGRDGKLPTTPILQWKEDSDDEDFAEECVKRRKLMLEKSLSACNSPALNESKVGIDSEFSPRKPPKIYFGTRTHKQIKQLVREFRKTSYTDVKMAIMSGREQTCINEVVLREASKNEACRNLLTDKDGSNCRYYSNLKRRFDVPSVMRGVLHRENLDVFDIEDIVSVGQKHIFCPYFTTTRVLVQDAELIFCPYNYLIDPLIRNSLSINLKGQIVIFDEAHNLEDSCRESSSFELTDDELTDACSDLHKLILLGVKEADTQPLYEAVNILREWLQKELESERLKRHTHEIYCEIWNGIETMAIMKDLKLDPNSVEILKQHYKELADEENENEKPKVKKALKASPVSLYTVEKLLTALQFLYTDNFKFAEDYKMCLQREMVFGKPKKDENKGGWLQTNRKRPEKMEKITLSFWAMNPGVAFSALGEVAKTVIVASGTLSPLVTFQSELSHKFEFQLEAPHVLPSDRVWIGAIGKGPKDLTLKATFEHTEEFEFQDEVGRLLLEVSSVVPGGVLCFMPSYKLLDKMFNRWTTTGQIDIISRRKLVVLEPRSGEQLSKNLDEFFEAVKNPYCIGPECTGAILLAICRGKVSEGIDFSDDTARAVITIGIPFPSKIDLQVDLKKRFNDEAVRKKRSTLTGSRWYETQAYRALNQALGRCIRHIRDWGSLIVVDERFSQPKNCAGLSKWIRQRIRYYNDFSTMRSSLKEFNERLSTESDNQPYSFSNSPGIIHSCGSEFVEKARVTINDILPAEILKAKVFVDTCEPSVPDFGPKSSTPHKSPTKEAEEIITVVDDSFDNEDQAAGSAFSSQIDLEESSAGMGSHHRTSMTMSQLVKRNTVQIRSPVKIEEFDEPDESFVEENANVSLVAAHPNVESQTNHSCCNSSQFGSSKRPCANGSDVSAAKRSKQSGLCCEQILCASCNNFLCENVMNAVKFTTVKIDRLPSVLKLAESCECLGEENNSVGILVMDSALSNVTYLTSNDCSFPLDCAYDLASGMAFRYVFCQNCMIACGCPMTEFLIGYHIVQPGKMALQHLHSKILLAQGAHLCLKPFIGTAY